MRGQRDKYAAEEAKAAGKAVEVIDVSEYQPRRIPSKKWRERIVELCFDDPFPDYDTEPVMAYANDPEFAA